MAEDQSNIDAVLASDIAVESTNAAPLIDVQSPLGWERVRQRRFGFWIGSLGLLSAHDVVLEVIQATTVTPIPNAPRWFLGVVNLRGYMFPIFDIGHLIAREIESSDASTAPNELLDSGKREIRNVVAVGEKRDLAGFVFDGLPVSLNVDDTTPRATRLPNLPAGLHAAFREFVYVDAKVWCSVDFDCLFRVLGEAAAEEMTNKFAAEHAIASSVNQHVDAEQRSDEANEPVAPEAVAI